jgi:hypothetical protein
MNPLTCPDVEARLDLFAADECDPAEAAAIRRHLADCPRCTAACGESRQLVGLLDLRFQEPERLRRLERRIAAEGQPRRRILSFPSGLRHVAALAAMLLLTVGLTGWLTPGLVSSDGGVELAAALREVPAPRGKEAVSVRAVPGPPIGVDAAFQFRAAAPIDLALELRNTTDRTMHVWVAGPPVELRLDLRGPGVTSVPATDSAEEEPRAVTLRPGESHVIHITRLTDGQRSWRWTKPGEYTLTAELTTRARVAGVGERQVTAHSEPLTILVGGE